MGSLHHPSCVNSSWMVNTLLGLSKVPELRCRNSSGLWFFISMAVPVKRRTVLTVERWRACTTLSNPSSKEANKLLWQEKGNNLLEEHIRVPIISQCLLIKNKKCFSGYLALIPQLKREQDHCCQNVPVTDDILCNLTYSLACFISPAKRENVCKHSKNQGPSTFSKAV